MFFGLLSGPIGFGKGEENLFKKDLRFGKREGLNLRGFTLWKAWGTKLEGARSESASPQAPSNSPIWARFRK